MPSYYIWTIGCQMNKAESDRLGSLLEQRGYRPVAAPESADLVVLNTCVVRQSAEDRVTNKLHLLRRLKASRPGLCIAVTGCFVDSNEAALMKRYPHVDYFFKAGEIPEWLEMAQTGDQLPEHAPVSVYVPIMQGCNNFCSYCIVPYRRGRERSRPLREISDEVRALVSRGAREIILLGQNVDSYGSDLAEGTDLAELLDELNSIDGLLRLRFLTNHPKDMSQKLIERVARLDKVCEHINLPVQAGDNAILEAMRRNYSVEHYCSLVERIRSAVPDVALTTDLIVGFPGEGEAQFLNSYRLIEKLRFDAVHVACYSPRKGTLAERQMQDDVPADEKKRRLTLIEELQEKIVTEINERLMGRGVEVLVDARIGGKWRGRTRSDKLVFFNAPGDYLGRLVSVRIERTGPWSLQGSLLGAADK